MIKFQIYENYIYLIKILRDMNEINLFKKN